MVKFRRMREKDIRNDPLHRWLIYFDKGSPGELIEKDSTRDEAESQDEVLPKHTPRIILLARILICPALDKWVY